MDGAFQRSHNKCYKWAKMTFESGKMAYNVVLHSTYKRILILLKNFVNVYKYIKIKNELFLGKTKKQK